MVQFSSFIVVFHQKDSNLPRACVLLHDALRAFPLLNTEISTRFTDFVLSLH